MSYLLDTNILIFSASKPQKLKPDIAALLANNSAIIYVSVIALWEIQIKRSIGKLPQITDEFFTRLPEQRYNFLPLKIEHIQQLGALPHHHRDPFDRMLVAQALAEKLTLITADQSLKKYGVKVMLA